MVLLSGIQVIDDLSRVFKPPLVTVSLLKYAATTISFADISKLEKICKFVLAQIIQEFLRDEFNHEFHVQFNSTMNIISNKL